METRLKIELMKLSDIKPYRRNAKKHPQEQIDQIKKSIEEFGFDDPIAVWGDENTIIEGHGRYLACKELGIDKVPVIRLDHLTDEQRKAYTLIHNKLTMNSDFDIETLNLELNELTEFDMSFYDFDIPSLDDEPNDREKYNEEERTVEKLNLDYFDDERCAGFYQLPTLKKCDHVPKGGLMSFDDIMLERCKGKYYDKGIHFFMHDIRFEKIWEHPMFFVEKLAQYDCVLTPDFSLYMNMPMAMKIWNVYRSRLIGQVMQDYGLKVIPTLTWAEPSTYDFVFDGIEPGGTMAVSSTGVMKYKDAQAVWKDGMNVAVEKLKPKNILIYGGKKHPDFETGGAKVHHYESFGFDKEER